MRDAEHFLGCRIKLEATDGLYEGVLKSLEPKSGRLTLCKVKSLKTGKNFTGVQNFAGRDIKNIEVLGKENGAEGRGTGSSKQGFERVSQDEGGPRLLERKLNPRHLKNLKDIQWEQILPGNKAPCDGRLKPTDVQEDNIDDEEGETVARQPIFSNKQENKPEAYTIINELGEQFDKAIKHIKGELNVGLGAEGVEIGRAGQLCWIQIATKQHVILFDIISLKEDGFKHGLKEVLECPDVQKIIHDCRALSDLLFHQYGVRLINVFDTQVAEAIVFRMRNNGDLPRYVEGLASSLFSRLDLSTEQVYVMRQREDPTQRDGQLWAERPLIDSLLKAAVKNVVYLRQLRLVLMEEMLSDFVDGVDIYLGVQRDVDDVQSKAKTKEKHRLPPEFKDIRNCAQMSRSYIKNQDNLQLYDEGGFRDNCSGVVDPYINWSHSGIWHAGTGQNRQTYHEPANRRGRARPRSGSASGPTQKRCSDGSSDEDVPLVVRGRAAMDKEKGAQAAKHVEKSDIPDIPDSPVHRDISPEPKRTSMPEDRMEVKLVAAGYESKTCLVKEKYRVRQVVTSSRSGGDSSYCTASEEEGPAQLDIIPTIFCGKTSNEPGSPVFQGNNLFSKKNSLTDQDTNEYTQDFNRSSQTASAVTSPVKNTSELGQADIKTSPPCGRGIGRGQLLHDILSSRSPGGLSHRGESSDSEPSPKPNIAKGRGTAMRKPDTSIY